MLKLKIPESRKGLEARIRYAEIVREKLRRLHNRMGAHYREGKINQAEYQRFLREEFMPQNHAVSRAILSLRHGPKRHAWALKDDDPALTGIDLAIAFELVPSTVEGETPDGG